MNSEYRDLLFSESGYSDTPMDDGQFMENNQPYDEDDNDDESNRDPNASYHPIACATCRSMHKKVSSWLNFN